MQHSNEKNHPLAIMSAGLVQGQAKAGEPSLTLLALRLLHAFWRVCCATAARVLSVGDCNVH